MEHGKTIISTLNILLSAMAVILAVYILVNISHGHCGDDYKTAASLAGELADNNFHKAAVEDYRRILDRPGLDNPTQANINYMIAKIYFENIGDYETAAAYYIRARSLNPNGSFYEEAGKNLIAS
ncbi:MAG: hypothetical protein NTV06_00165, partial [candidate division Zixibacteria bacterium]|nr:hypothetical protein [candidate division Zixibacteria bacterium]